ncbi:hypothetical protein EB796_022434 [Bugula neritina]|uniref:Uncharacterized protein n=1 Tax=Bugula neritina TaxID=10212 RepID=A0A7J7IZP5_BUGNE|nr:hypothetical protein EB796_022434 [Bugula neritina]
MTTTSVSIHWLLHQRASIWQLPGTSLTAKVFCSGKVLFAGCLRTLNIQLRKLCCMTRRHLINFMSIRTAKVVC